MAISTGAAGHPDTAEPARGDGALIRARGLVKRFGSAVAVDGIDLEVEAGEVFGFLGPNGAGKTSAMRMIAAVSPVTGGELRVLGADPAVDGPAIRARLGVVGQENIFDEELSVAENLYIYGRYFGIPRAQLGPKIDELLEFAQLSARADDRVTVLSGGMKRRLVIARSLINSPELVLLDEPTTGLDPQARQLVWHRLYELKQRGVTQLLTTHYMDEAEQLCDRLVVMSEGRIIARGAPADLIAEHAGREVVELRFTPGARDGLVDAVGDLGDRREVLADRVLLYSQDADDLLATVRRRDAPAATTLVRRATLEDVFLRLTGRQLVE